VDTIGSFSFGGSGPVPALPEALRFIEHLAISGTASPNLAAFDGVANIDGLSVSDSQLETLEGLHHDGTLDQGLRLQFRQELDLSALSGVTQVQSLTVNGSRQSTLAGLGGLKTIERSLDITGSDLRDLDGLSSLETVGTWIFITENPELTSLQGLSRLSSFGADQVMAELIIENNPVLPQCQVAELYERFGLLATGLGNDEAATCN
jgi:Leucine-rich repeat (LRR) protein